MTSQFLRRTVWHRDVTGDRRSSFVVGRNWEVILSQCLKKGAIACICFLLAGCGFHLQGETPLAPKLHRLYLQTPDPYGYLARSLEQYLKLSHVQLVCSPKDASAVLAILRDDTSQELLSVSGTQQTRQYILRVTVVFEINDPSGLTLIQPQTLSESRTITVQSNQILGSSNETNLFYQQMRRILAYAIINRLASREITANLESADVTPGRIFPKTVRRP